MQADLFISRVLDDEGLTSGLNDPEARLLIDWLIEQVEGIAANATDEAAAAKTVEVLCRKVRGIRRFVSLWCDGNNQAAATQLAGAERFHWPMPAPDDNDPCDVLQQILNWETSQAAMTR